MQDPTGKFHLMTPGQATDFSGVKGGTVQPVRVTDEGEVNVAVAVEVDFIYNHSLLLMRYMINKATGVLELEMRLFYAESEKRLKLWIPTTLTEGEHIGQTIFDRESALLVIDDGVYGSNYYDGNFAVTLVRSAGYGAGHSVWREAKGFGVCR